MLGRIEYPRHNRYLCNEHKELVITELPDSTNCYLIKSSSGYVITDSWLTWWIVVYNYETGDFAIDDCIQLSEQQIITIKAFIRATAEMPL